MKIKLFWFNTFALIILISTNTFADRIRNGGRLVMCFTQVNYQSLDFVIAKGFSNKEIKMAKIKSADESFGRIAKILMRVSPDMSVSFQKFVGLIYNQNPSEPFFWKAGRTEPEPTEDDHFLHIPYSCRQDGRVEFLQAITREKLDSNHLVFEYDADALIQLQRTAPMQFSFIIVHEWLWNYTADITRNRKLDYLIHSSVFDSLTPSQIRDEFAKAQIHF